LDGTRTLTRRRFAAARTAISTQLTTAIGTKWAQCGFDLGVSWGEELDGQAPAGLSESAGAPGVRYGSAPGRGV